MKETKVILHFLQSKGVRITQARRAIIENLALQNTPISAEQLQCALQDRGIAVNKTTVYRELDFLLRWGIIQAIEFGDKKKRYEISGSHHHHVVCIECNTIEDVDLQQDVRASEQKIEKQKGYKVINHSLEFFGLCPTCQ